MFLKSQFEINGAIINIPQISILVAPQNLQNVLENLGANVLATVKNNLWNLVLDAFKPKQQRFMANTQENINSPEEEYEIIWHKEAISPENGMPDISNADSNKPEGYNADFDLTKYVK